MNRHVLTLLALTAALAGCAGPTIETIVALDRIDEPASNQGTAWDPIELGTITETTTVVIDGDVDADATDRRVPVDPSRIRWSMHSDDGETIELERVEWSDYPGHRHHLAAEPPAPGAWQVVAEVDGAEEARFDYAVTEHGVASMTDPTAAYDAFYVLDDGLNRGGPGRAFADGVGLLSGAIVVHFAPERPSPGHFVQTWVKGLEAPCRSWSGELAEADAEAGGLLEGDGDFTASSGVPVTLADADITVGLHPDGQSMAGVSVRGEVNIRDLDPLTVAPGEPVDPAATDRLVNDLGAVPQPCAEGGDHCLDVWLHSGVGRRITEAEARELLGAPEDWPDLYTAEACAGLQDGDLEPIELNCSVIGSAGLGVWFLGLGALLMRRRRST